MSISSKWIQLGALCRNRALDATVKRFFRFFGLHIGENRRIFAGFVVFTTLTSSNLLRWKRPISGLRYPLAEDWSTHLAGAKEIKDVP